MNYIVLRHVGAFLFSIFFTFYITPLISRIAYRFNILDIPDGVLKTHSKGTPYLGGICIYGGFIATLGLFFPLHNIIVWLLTGITFLLFLGLIDDLIVLTPTQKWCGQWLAILFLLKGGMALKAEFFSDSINIVLSLFWMLLVINAFNLVDVMDGLACSLALTASFSFFLLALFSQTYDLSLLILCFMGPLISFLWYNKPPAQIYLGDCGALFIGGFLAAIPFLFKWSSYSLYAYCTPLFILAVPLGEVGLLILLRTWEGLPIYRGSPHHFSLLLQKRGFSKGFILMISNIFSFLLAFLILIVLHQRISIGFFSLLVAFLSLSFGGFLLKGYKKENF